VDVGHGFKRIPTWHVGVHPAGARR
jgi:hypothetical protein